MFHSCLSTRQLINKTKNRSKTIQTSGTAYTKIILTLQLKTMTKWDTRRMHRKNKNKSKLTVSGDVISVRNQLNPSKYLTSDNIGIWTHCCVLCFVWRQWWKNSDKHWNVCKMTQPLYCLRLNICGVVVVVVRMILCIVFGRCRHVHSWCSSWLFQFARV